MPTHLDLFSGIGGFALAARWTGWTTIGFSEIDPYACKILKKHWPEVPNFGDICNLKGVRADLITGGFPCQPFSFAGKRLGAKDHRHLWPEMCRVVADARPAWVLAENAIGIVKMELDNVLSDLEALGYTAQAIVIPACSVDARHLRNRVWIMANAYGVRLGKCRYDKYVFRVDEAQKKGWMREPDGSDKTSGKLFNRWPLEPKVVRVAHGIPNRVDRLRGLGNAIVPQIAAVILDAMLHLHNDPTET